MIGSQPREGVVPGIGSGPRAPVAPETKAMAAIGAAASAGSALAPRAFLQLLGIRVGSVTPAAVLGWRLFAARTAPLSALAARGNPTARDMFLPVQILDQLAWWEMYRRGALSLRATAILTGASAAIITLDLRRRLRR